MIFFIFFSTWKVHEKNSLESYQTFRNQENEATGFTHCSLFLLDDYILQLSTLHAYTP